MRTSCVPELAYRWSCLPVTFSDTMPSPQSTVYLADEPPTYIVIGSLAVVVVQVVTKSSDDKCRTVMVTVSVSVSVPVSVTVSVNVMSVFSSTSGAVNLGISVSEPVSVTAGPPVCSHRYVRESPSSGSLEPVPSSVTVSPGITV